MIYFDSAATTLQKPASVPAAVADAIDTMTTPGRGDHPAARMAADLMLRCRMEAAELFDVPTPENVILTSNATHGLNIAIRSLVSSGDTVVISGWAQNVTFYVSIFRQLAGTGCMTVLDCSGEALWQCLACRPFLVKPNLTELGALFGVEDLEYTEGVELAQQLQREGARNVLVSMGGSGAFLLTEGRELYFANACCGRTVNTVGAGDSLVAGFITGFMQSGDFGRALQMGVAAGCATAFSDWLGSGELTMELMEQIRVEKSVL